MKRMLFAGFAVLVTITTVMAVSGGPKIKSDISEVKCAPEAMAMDTVPGKSGKHKKSDTSNYPKTDTAMLGN